MKIFNIILSIFLISSSVGSTLAKHYCMDELVEVNVKPKTSLCCDNEDCCTQDVDFQSLVVETQKNLQFLASPSAKFILLYSILPIEDRNHLLSEGLSAISYRDIPYPEIHFSTDRYISIQSLLI